LSDETELSLSATLAAVCDPSHAVVLLFVGDIESELRNFEFLRERLLTRLRTQACAVEVPFAVERSCTEIRAKDEARDAV
jgi:hypothetical protein